MQPPSRSQSRLVWASVKKRFLDAPVHDLPVGAEDDGDDGPVAAQPSNGLGGQVGAGIEPTEGGGRAEPVLEVVVAHGE
ncbi:hypothetical protein, partial [Pedococcus cremeus]|uniref:hypothetical protein n=1 Tax=Pedococcus cremeus TaxID=587636 RepID=UPI001FE11C2A